MHASGAIASKLAPFLALAFWPGIGSAMVERGGADRDRRDHDRHRHHVVRDEERLEEVQARASRREDADRSGHGTVPVTSSPAGSRSDPTECRPDRAVDERQRGRDGAVREQALPDPRTTGNPTGRTGRRPMSHERLDQVPAPAYAESFDLVPLSAVMPPPRSDDQDRRLPHQFGPTPRHDVLGGVVQRLGTWLFRGVRPEGAEDVVGPASEQEVERAASRLAHDLHHALVPIGRRPATVRETAVVVLSALRSLQTPSRLRNVITTSFLIARPFDRIRSREATEASDGPARAYTRRRTTGELGDTGLRGRLHAAGDPQDLNRVIPAEGDR